MMMESQMMREVADVVVVGMIEVDLKVGWDRPA
jgi:hypothetical protein